MTPSKSPELALALSKAFYDLAMPFLNHLKKHPSATNEIASENIQHLMTSATNMLLSIEVAIKGLLIKSKINYGTTHNLKPLFYLLPTPIKDKVLTEFKTRSKNEPPESLELQIGNFDPTTEPASLPNKSDSLLALLDRNHNAYTNWRYLFDLGPAESFIAYEYSRLRLLANVIHDQYPQQTLIRRF